MLLRKAILQFPEGSVALDSPFYIQRSSIDSLCRETVIKPGALIRIKAPEMMGKTSLMTRILARAVREKYQAVYLDLSAADLGILTNLDKFLRWLCLMVSRQLKLENKLNEYWNTDILGSNDNCTVYFEEYLLAETPAPLVLGLDEVARLFAYTEVVEDFSGDAAKLARKSQDFGYLEKTALGNGAFYGSLYSFGYESISV
jgi:hypothetical protein